MAKRKPSQAGRRARSARRASSPAPLATPTDLNSREAGAIVAALNPLIADAFALYVKTKNFHWHVAGPHFRDYHLMFDEHAEQVFSAIDDMAERARMLGGTTIRSVNHISRLQTIRDDDADFVSAGQMLEILMNDNRGMAEHLRAAVAVCDDNRDPSTSDLLQGVLGATEKRIWFLFEAMQKL